MVSQHREGVVKHAFLLTLPVFRAGHKVFQHPLLDAHFLYKILITVKRTITTTSPMLTVCKIGLCIIDILLFPPQLYFVNIAAWLSIGPTRLQDGVASYMLHKGNVKN